MTRDEFLYKVKKQIRFVYDRKAIEKELWEHIQESKEDMMRDGLSPDEAEVQSVMQMGDPVEIGKLLNEEHHPTLGYAWLISKIALIILIVAIACPIGISFFHMVRPVWPPELDIVDTYKINLLTESPTHFVEINDVVIRENGNTELTFRLWKKYSYNRIWVYVDTFGIEDSNGKNIQGGGIGNYYRGILGARGDFNFEWPKDDIIYIVFSNGDSVRIDLKEYCYE